MTCHDSFRCSFFLSACVNLWAGESGHRRWHSAFSPLIEWRSHSGFENWNNPFPIFTYNSNFQEKVAILQTNLKFTKTGGNIFIYLSPAPRTSLLDACLWKLKAEQAPGSDHLPADSHRKPTVCNGLLHWVFKVPQETQGCCQSAWHLFHVNPNLENPGITEGRNAPIWKPPFLVSSTHVVVVLYILIIKNQI